MIHNQFDEQSISGFDYITVLYGAMLDFANVTEHGIRCSNIHLLRILPLAIVVQDILT